MGSSPPRGVWRSRFVEKSKRSKEQEEIFLVFTITERERENNYLQMYRGRPVRPMTITPKNKKRLLKPPFQTPLNAPKECLKKRTPPLLRALYRSGDRWECNARFSFKKRAVGRAPALSFTPFSGGAEPQSHRKTPEKKRCTTQEHR